MEILEKKIKIDENDLVAIFGYNDTFLQMIENRFNASMMVRGSNLIIKGDPEEIKQIETIFREFKYLLNRNGVLTKEDVSTIIGLVDANREEPEAALTATNPIIFHGAREIIRARNAKQQEFFRKVNANDLVFSIGPAGTGKTFLAVAMALAYLRRNEVSRIILSRPAVEAGESLGFLPGDLKEKIDPYLRPLTDSLHYMLSPDKMKNLMEKEVIEISPLAYMRGRTLNNSFIILDEAQNATGTQMKMFLTRMGEHSKAIVTGDITQIDLSNKRDSGLLSASRILKDVEGIGFVRFGNRDVVRHKLVAEIIRAYEAEDEKKHSGKKETEIPAAADGEEKK
ncbi:MAG: PhoH family protein [Candidatus Kapaibacterium sp.]